MAGLETTLVDARRDQAGAASGRRSRARASSVRTVVSDVLARHRWSTIGLAVGSLAAGLAESTILALVAATATEMVTGGDEVGASIGPFTVEAPIGGVLAVSAVLGAIRLILQVFVAYLPARIGADTQADLRHQLFLAYSKASWDVQADEREGHLQELLTNQIGMATQAWLQATTLLSAGLTFLTLVLTAFVLGPLTAILVLAVAAVLGFGLRPLAKRGRQYSHRLSQAQIDYAADVSSAVRLAEETYAFGTEEAARERLGAGSERARRNFLLSQFTGRLTQGVYQGLVILMLVGALAGLHASGSSQIASLGAVILILVRAAAYGQQSQVAWQAVQQARPFLERLTAAEARYRERPLVSGTAPFPSPATIRLRNVAFAYRPDRPILNDVSFDVEPGELVGIVGPSGSGKSTLVQLLLRMRVPTAGLIDVGSVPLHDIDLDDWRRQVAYVPQEPRLLHATVAENIRFDRPISDADVEQAARLAHIHDVIVKMPDGYQTVVGQRADAVSGGQRQRLCLARALAGHPSVLILDEPTSALDAASEAEIRASLEQLHGRPTIFVVAHRATLLEVCDRIIRVDGGVVSISDRPLFTGEIRAGDVTP